MAPGADPNRVKFRFDGARNPRLAANGDLILKLKGAELRQHKPRAYQDDGGVHREVACSYALKGKREVGFAVGQYDITKPLVIDPALSYSTYLGSSGTDTAQSIAVDSDGNAYVTGTTSSTFFPTANAVQGTKQGAYDAYVTKLSASGSSLVYSTFLGGAAGQYSDEGGYGIAVDHNGNAYVTGYTASTDFPTASALQSSLAGGLDAFVVKLNAAGSAFVYSTYLGGAADDFGKGIAVDLSGNPHVTGYTASTDFPTANALQSTYGGNVDAFVSKLNAAGSALVYSTYLGGSDDENGCCSLGRDGGAIAVDSDGNAYVTGNTWSDNFPTLNPYQASRVDFEDVFVTKLNASGAMVYSTYLGGNGADMGRGIAVDGAGNAYVAGGGIASTNFPVANAFQSATTSGGSAFVTKLNSDGSALAYSTYLSGSSGFTAGNDIAVDSTGNAYVTGWTNETDFPTANAVQPTYVGGQADAFVAKLSTSGSALSYSTFIGGTGPEDSRAIAVDSAGNAYVAGHTYSTDFPIRSAYKANHYGFGFDVFVFKLGNANGYRISGRVADAGNSGISNVAVTLSGTQTDATYTDSSGNYSFLPVEEGGNYTVTPSKTYYVFTPPTQSFNNLSADQTVDFIGTTHVISGRVADAGGAGIVDVTMTLSGSASNTGQTDGDGDYSFSVTPGGTYTVTPSKPSYIFSLPSQTFSNISSNQTANFTGTRLITSPVA